MYFPGVLMNAVSTGKANYATAIPVYASNALAYTANHCKSAMPQELMTQFKDFVEEKRAASLDASMSKCWINPVVTSSNLSHITSQNKSNHTGRKHNYEVF